MSIYLYSHSLYKLVSSIACIDSFLAVFMLLIIKSIIDIVINRSVTAINVHPKFKKKEIASFSSELSSKSFVINSVKYRWAHNNNIRIINYKLSYVILMIFYHLSI